MVQVAWLKGAQVQQLWRHVMALLAYPHLWIRKAAGRLLGLLLSSNKLGKHHALQWRLLLSYKLSITVHWLRVPPTFKHISNVLVSGLEPNAACMSCGACTCKKPPCLQDMLCSKQMTAMFAGKLGHQVRVLSPALVVGAGLLSGEGTRPGQLALAVYCQLEGDIDDTLAAQAVKCLVHLSQAMLAVHKKSGLLHTDPIPQLDAAAPKAAHSDAVSNGHLRPGSVLSVSARSTEGNAEAADSEADSDVEEEVGRQQELDGAPRLTLQGLVKRMAKMAGDRSGICMK